MIFDTHTHYDDKRFDEDRDALLASLPAEGIGAVMAVGADPASSEQSLVLAEKISVYSGGSRRSSG